VAGALHTFDRVSEVAAHPCRRHRAGVFDLCGIGAVRSNESIRRRETRRRGKGDIIAAVDSAAMPGSGAEVDKEEEDSTSAPAASPTAPPTASPADSPATATRSRTKKQETTDEDAIGKDQSDVEVKSDALKGAPQRKSSRQVASKKSTSPPAASAVIPDKTKRKSPRSASIKKSSKAMKDCDDTLSEMVDNSTTNNQEGETSSSGDHSDERDTKRIPIREILTPPRRQPVRRKKELDATTLDLFKATLKETKGDALEENEVLHFATRLYRNADQQVAYDRSLSRRSILDPGEESEHSSAFAECLADEEDYAIGNEQFKKTVALINKKTAASAPKSQSSGYKMDRRTLNWIKGLSRIHRKDKHVPVKGRVSTRRYSHKQARVKRTPRQEKGLDILCAAIEEVELDHGPFPKAIRRPVSKKRPNADNEQPAKATKKARTESKGRSNKVSGVAVWWLI
jgi:hypothetical protein